jgi:hypothetical protein
VLLAGMPRQVEIFSPSKRNAGLWGVTSTVFRARQHSPGCLRRALRPVTAQPRL